MKKKILAISSALFLIATLLYGNGGLGFFQNSNTVYAIGDLTVDWGTGTGDVGPIFNVSGFVPGQSEDREVIVSNGASTTRPVGIKAVKTDGVGNLETGLNIVISKGGLDLYGGSSPTGPKTVAEFFIDSNGSDFVELESLPPSGSSTYTILVTFNQNAGNSFQNTSVIFNLIIGLAVDVPSECSGISFSSPTPIFGTSGNDNLRGTNKNDLIILFEGNDRVLALGGDDCIIGGPGNDELRGELGNDIIIGNEGVDLLIGAAGKDKITGGDGADVIRGEVGADIIEGNEGNDNITGGGDPDQINAGPGSDFVRGEDGNDTILGESGNDQLIGGAGKDNLNGGLDIDTVNGESGQDTCIGETKIMCEL
jgi:Ca2+-binding RTX toxin-like protein